MKILSFNLKPFQVDFKEEVFGQGPHKNGFYLELFSNCGRKGIGETAGSQSRLPARPGRAPGRRGLGAGSRPASRARKSRRTSS